MFIVLILRSRIAYTRRHRLSCVLVGLLKVHAVFFGGLVRRHEFDMVGKWGGSFLDLQMSERIDLVRWSLRFVVAVVRHHGGQSIRVGRLAVWLHEVHEQERGRVDPDDVDVHAADRGGKIATRTAMEFWLMDFWLICFWLTCFWMICF